MNRWVLRAVLIKRKKNHWQSVLGKPFQCNGPPWWMTTAHSRPFFSKAFPSHFVVLMTPLQRPPLFQDHFCWILWCLYSHMWGIIEEIWLPGSAFYYFVKVEISSVILVALFQAKVQFTVAQWADTNIDDIPWWVVCEHTMPGQQSAHSDFVGSWVYVFLEL